VKEIAAIAVIGNQFTAKGAKDATEVQDEKPSDEKQTKTITERKTANHIRPK
jgi:hypothetical protein